MRENAQTQEGDAFAEALPSGRTALAWADTHARAGDYEFALKWLDVGMRLGDQPAARLVTKRNRWVRALEEQGRRRTSREAANGR